MLLKGHGGRMSSLGRCIPSFEPLCSTFVEASMEGCVHDGEVGDSGLSGILCCISRR